MKHAYLIIAHNEFGHLQRLISAIDDERNDIYVHIDRKVKRLPELHTTKSKLTVLDRRIDVRWGTRSQIRSEYVLLEAATEGGNYDYYHIISGTHFPLKSQDEIHRWFDEAGGRSVLQAGDHTEADTRFKLGRYHFFLRWIQSHNLVLARLSNILWRGSLLIQNGIVKRNYSPLTLKCHNWVSLSHADVMELLRQKDRIMKQMRYTFCGDEFFVPTALREAGKEFISTDRLLFADFRMAGPVVLKESDFDRLKASGCMFARKLSAESAPLTERIEKECLAPKHQS